MDGLNPLIAQAVISTGVLLLGGVGYYAAAWLRGRGKTAEAAGRRQEADVNSQEIVNNLIGSLFQPLFERHNAAMERIAALEEQRAADERERAKERTEVLEKNASALKEVGGLVKALDARTATMHRATELQADASSRVERAILAQTQAFQALVDQDESGRTKAVNEVETIMNRELQPFEAALFALEEGMNRLLKAQGLDPITPPLATLLAPASDASPDATPAAPPPHSGDSAEPNKPTEEKKEPNP